MTKDPNRPFFVQADGTEIRVLGTRFNVKSYLDEPEVTTTLMSGSIEMRLPDSEETYRLTPGKTLRFNRMTGDIALFSTPEYNYIPPGSAANSTSTTCRCGTSRPNWSAKFDVRIIIRTPEIGDLRFFAGFVNNESVDEILAALNIQKQFGSNAGATSSTSTETQSSKTTEKPDYEPLKNRKHQTESTEHPPSAFLRNRSQHQPLKRPLMKKTSTNGGFPGGTLLGKLLAVLLAAHLFLPVTAQNRNRSVSTCRMRPSNT